MLFRAILFLLTAMMLFSCGRQTSGMQENGDTLQMKYATLLTVVRHDGYTEVSIRNPWKEGKTLHTYLLVPRHAEIPGGLPHGTVIRTPIERAAVFTTVHCALLTELEHADDIKAVADFKYIKIPAIREAVAQGRIADCGSGMSPVVEKIIDVKPDIIMLSPFENSGGYGKLEDINIPLVECAEYMETSPLGRAEWMKFYGMLLDEGQKADSLFNIVDHNYQSLKRLAIQAGEGRSLLIDRMVGSVWYVPGGRSTIGQMAQDAGARYPWAADEHSGSLPLTFETVLERAANADVWMFRYSSDRQTSRKQLLSDYHGYSQLKAFCDGEVYACNVEQTLFYEETPFRPDFLLSDFIQVVHPGIKGLPALRYYKKTE